MRTVILNVLVIFFGFTSNVLAVSNEEIAEKYTPTEVLQAKDTDSNPPKAITKNQIKKKIVEYDFGTKDGTKYLLATYSNENIPVDNPRTVLILIKVSKNGATSVLPFDDDNSIDQRTEVTLFDLNNDGIKELILSTFSDKRDFSDSEVYKWNGTILKNITSQITGGKSTLISSLQLSALPLLVFSESVSPTDEKSAEFPQKIRQLTSKGIVDLGTFDFIKIVEKTSGKVIEESATINNLAEGQYSLEVKNLSKHPRSVRAEISINDIVVLKPTDFCRGKPKPFIKQKDKKGHDVSEDDDDDGNEDRCKRCDPKKDIYANVNLKAEENTLKVKLFGKKDSKIQITLKKKQ